MAVFNRKHCTLLLYSGGALVRSYNFSSVAACDAFILMNKELLRQFTYEIKKAA